MQQPSRTVTTLDELTNQLLLSNDGQAQKTSKSIIPVEGGFQYKRFTFTTIGLIAPDDTTEQEWEDIGHILLNFQGSISWLLGDWLAFGEDRKWGETYQRLAERYQYEVETLWTYAWIARAVDSSIRIEELSFTHHRKVASLEDRDEQRKWLDLALKNKWSVATLGKQIDIAKSSDGSNGGLTIVDDMLSYLTKSRKKLDRLFGKFKKADRGERMQAVDLIDQEIQHLQELRNRLKD